jgi:hypothetical protein
MCWKYYLHINKSRCLVNPNKTAAYHQRQAKIQTVKVNIVFNGNFIVCGVITDSDLHQHTPFSG